MDSATDSELEVIRAQTHQTRAQLAEKIGALESQVSKTVAGVTSAVETVNQTVSGVTEVVGQVAEKVSDTVSGVTDTVTGTVDAVKTSLTGTVDAVKDTVSQTVGLLDVQPAIQNAPWTSVGCAFAAGLAAGYLTGGSSSSSSSSGGMVGGLASGLTAGLTSLTGMAGGVAQGAPAPSAPRHGGQGSSGGQPSEAFSAFGDTLSDLGTSARSLGVSALMGLVSHLARQAVPEAMKQDVCTALDKLKTRLGGRHDVNPETFLKS